MIDVATALASALGGKQTISLLAAGRDIEMKLSTGQWLWMSAATLVIATILLEIANVMNVPPIYWMLGCGLLTVIGWWVMPSIKELNKAKRRRS